MKRLENVMTVLLTVVSAALLFIGAKFILDLFYSSDQEAKVSYFPKIAIGSLLLLSGIVVACVSLSMVVQSIY